jgi:hypothetical protein
MVYASGAGNRTMSYQQGWPRHFAKHSRFACVPVNLADRRLTARLRSALRARRDGYDAVILLHSVFSNACMVGPSMVEALARLRAPKVYFIGNEYKLMPEKMAFCDALGVALLVSQSESPAVHDLYRARLKCAVVGIPNTGLDPEIFQPRTPRAARPIDIGYRAVDSPDYLGHDERRRIAEFFRANAGRYGLRTDISLRPDDRFAEPAWAEFLNRCRAQLGTEAGGDYFELTDARRLAVNAYLRERPAASHDEIQATFFQDAVPLPMRILSGRNVEAAGTKTLQILFEGHYGGYLQPDVHYIPVRKDLADADEAMAKFRDDAVGTRIADAAYDLAMSTLTYAHLIDRFHAALAPLV